VPRRVELVISTTIGRELILTSDQATPANIKSTPASVNMRAPPWTSGIPISGSFRNRRQQRGRGKNYRQKEQLPSDRPMEMVTRRPILLAMIPEGMAKITNNSGNTDSKVALSPRSGQVLVCIQGENASTAA